MLLEKLAALSAKQLEGAANRFIANNRKIKILGKSKNPERTAAQAGFEHDLTDLVGKKEFTGKKGPHGIPFTRKNLHSVIEAAQNLVHSKQNAKAFAAPAKITSHEMKQLIARNRK